MCNLLDFIGGDITLCKESRRAPSHTLKGKKPHNRISLPPFKHAGLIGNPGAVFGEEQEVPVMLVVYTVRSFLGGTD